MMKPDLVVVANAGQARLFRRETYGGLMVFASSPFLGEVKGQFGARVQKALRAAVDSDLTSLSLDEVERRVDHALHAAR